MSLLIDAPFSNVTTYRKDYTKKTGKRFPPILSEPDYKNPITGPLEEHVLPYAKYKQLPENQTRYPHPGEYSEMVANKYPITRTFLKDPPGGPPDLSVIDKLYANENKTTYMVSYCLTNSGSETDRMKKPKILPEGWVVPLTTQKCSYRHPSVLSPEGLVKIIISQPKNNLTPNMKERELLGVKTGETTYIAEIGNTGDEIIKGKLHGDVNVRPQFDPDEILRAKLIRTH